MWKPHLFKPTPTPPEPTPPEPIAPAEETESPPETDWRTAILEDFAAWLYELTEEEAATLAEETAPDAPDLFSLLAELTALRQEVKLQARTTQKAGRIVEELSETIGETLDAQRTELTSAATDWKAQVAAARREAETPLLGELLDLRERIALTVGAVEALPAPRRGWRRKAAESWGPIREAQGQLMDRADDALRRLGLQPIGRLSEPFDATCMRAGAATETGAAPGTVTAILRQGYRREGRIVRWAEVDVEKES